MNTSAFNRSLPGTVAPFGTVAAPSPAPSSSASIFSPQGEVQQRLQQLKNERRQPGEADFFWYDTQFKSISVKVKPGEYAAYNEDVLIATVLGSCIAACIWDPKAAVGGMNHFMLPDASVPEEGGRYGAFAMEVLINQLLKLGAQRSNLQAKIFGGGRVMTGMNSFDIGERNTRFATDYLRTEGIPIVGQDVLGPHPRKVVFWPLTGKAMIKRLPPSELQPLTREERSLTTKQISNSPSSIELF